jgi:hypothetical protein
MLPAPARIAAPPRPRSKVSWSPAVPPPPVAGAAVGNGLADRLSGADGRAEGLALALGVVTRAELLGVTVGRAEAVRAGENVVGVAEGEGEDAVQAETDAEASMATVAHPAAVNLPLSPVPVMVVCIFTGLLTRPAGFRSRYRKVKPADGTDMQWPVHHWKIRLRD